MSLLIRSLFFFSYVAAVTASAKPPAWLATLASQPATLEYGDAGHAVLLDEGELTIDKNGAITRRTRYAIRVLTREGRDAALARVRYETSSHTVKSLLAWLIPASGKALDYGKKHTTDIASYSSALELYGESRQRIIAARDDVSPGDVFGFEAVTVERSIFSQELWHFQQKVPVEVSSITINLPEGWSLESRTFNHAPIARKTTGTSHSWELRSLPATADEPFGPPRHARLPWLAIDLLPPAGVKALQRLSFPTWSGLSSYFSPEYETASTPDAALQRRAAALVEGAATPWERIVRLCRFAQEVNYISINLNAREAGGMIPRAASRVLLCNYGDCKDKTTLLRSLLRAQGIASYAIIVYSGDSTHVRPEWVSPTQFNHCIVAIQVDDSIAAPGIVNHPTLGRLLIFDPTNEFTPPGWLPREDLDGLGLILAGGDGGLMQLPAIQPVDNRFERTIAAQLDAHGTLTGTIRETFLGNCSAIPRKERKSASATAYRTDIIEPWLRRSLPAAHATRVDSSDDFAAARFALDIDFNSSSYGKLMRDSLLVFKPVIVARRDHIALKKEPRTQPVLIAPASFTETTEIALPAGFAVDELTPPVELISPFGSYSAQAEIRGGKLVFSRTLELRSATLPAAEYETARTFFENMLRAEQSPVVLKRL